jgi:hypothetical protein
MTTQNERPNAEKWDEERVLINLVDIERMALHDAETLFLGRALIRQGLYAHIWGYWKRKFTNHGDIKYMMQRIESIFEARLFEGALRKEVSPWVAIFGLKNNHHWNNMPEGEEPDKLQRQPMYVGLDEKTIMVIP